MSISKRVIKLGGSLLAWPSVFLRFEAWLADQPSAMNLIVTGGGELADWWRKVDKVHNANPEQMHDRAVAAMTENAKFVHYALSESIWVESLSDPQLDRPVGLAVANVTVILGTLERSGKQALLPRSWSVTADSIAAWLATAWEATELVLLKSRAAPKRRSDWVAEEFVDREFDNVKPGCTVRWVNLRD